MIEILFMGIIWPFIKAFCILYMLMCVWTTSCDVHEIKLMLKGNEEP